MLRVLAWMNKDGREGSRKEHKYLGGHTQISFAGAQARTGKEGSYEVGIALAEALSLI